MAKSNSALPLIVIGGVGVGAALYFASRAKAAAANDSTPELPADTSSAPKALPAPRSSSSSDDSDSGGGANEYTDAAAAAIQATVPKKVQEADELANALAAAKKAQAAEAKRKKAEARAAAAPPPKAVKGKNGGLTLVSQQPDTPAPDTHAEEAEDSGSFRTAPFVAMPAATMPAAKPTSTKPKGTDLAKAKSMAASVAGNLKSKGKSGYDKKQLAAFQTAAGLTGDGVYGPASQAALKYFGAKNAPAAFVGGKVRTYTPPK